MIGTWLDRLINRIMPPPHFPHPGADWLADIEADLDTWPATPPAGAPPSPPTPRPGGTTHTDGAEHRLEPWEVELRDSILAHRTKVQADIAAVAAAILRGHNIIGAPIYADLIAEAIYDQFRITTKPTGGQQ